MATTEGMQIKYQFRWATLGMWERTIIYLSLGRSEWHVAQASDNIVEHNLTTLWPRCNHCVVIVEL